MDNKSALHIEHFTKKYGDFTAVDDLNLDIAKGEFFGFLGPNGAGKSTTIHCITGISRITDGEILVNGVNVKNDYKEARQHIGLSPQEFNVDIFAPTKDILWYVAGYYGIPKKERKQHIEEMIEVFDLKDHANKPFRALSGGLKRRAMLARAMVHDPDILILDEPTAGVDVELRHELWDYLRQLNKKGKTIILTSHYLEEVELLCNRIGVINHGKLVALGMKDELVSDGMSLEKKYLELIKENNNTKK